MIRSLVVSLVAAGTLVPAAAAAHVSVTTGPAFAGTTQVVTFSVGHGCEGADTSSVRIEIPESIGAIRAVPSPFGSLAIEREATDRIVAVTWTRPEAELLPKDDVAYLFSLRIGIPDAPFSTLYFPTLQTCRREDGTTLTSEWVATPGEEGEPAPALTILPRRVPGWNRITVPVAIESLKSWFADAEIVWRGKAAFSANEHTASQIAATEGVSVLSALSAGDEIWVRY